MEQFGEVFIRVVDPNRNHAWSPCQHPPPKGPKKSLWEPQRSPKNLGLRKIWSNREPRINTFLSNMRNSKCLNYDSVDFRRKEDSQIESNRILWDQMKLSGLLYFPSGTAQLQLQRRPRAALPRTANERNATKGSQETGSC